MHFSSGPQKISGKCISVSVLDMYLILYVFCSYDQECFERDMSTKDILREKVGVCREYVKIFSEFCELAGYRVKGIRGYTKGPNFVPGTYYLNIKCGCIDFSFLSDTFFNYCLVIARVSGFL